MVSSIRTHLMFENNLKSPHKDLFLSNFRKWFCIKYDEKSILKLGNYNFEFLKLHEAYLSLVLDVSEYSVLMEFDYFHDGSLFNEEEVLPLGPGILQSVGEQLSFIVGKELSVFVI